MTSSIHGVASGLVWSAVLGTVLFVMPRVVEHSLDDPGHYGIADIADQAGSGASPVPVPGRQPSDRDVPAAAGRPDRSGSLYGRLNQ